MARSFYAPKIIFVSSSTSGVAHYNEHNYDAAYVAWSEAMQLATTEKNREWMHVITQNLQRLSYELLSAEGAKLMEEGRMDEAAKSLEMAAEVARKARNSQWEAEIARSKRNLLHAMFKQKHEAATKRLDEVLEYKCVEVDGTDDRFQEDGKLEVHSSRFVNEWAIMLMIKEAMELWSEAFSLAKQVGGQLRAHPRGRRQVVGADGVTVPTAAVLRRRVRSRGASYVTADSIPVRH